MPQLGHGSNAVRRFENRRIARAWVCFYHNFQRQASNKSKAFFGQKAK